MVHCPRSLAAGKCFGEIALLVPNASRTASIVARTFCETHLVRAYKRSNPDTTTGALPLLVLRGVQLHDPPSRSSLETTLRRASHATPT